MARVLVVDDDESIRMGMERLLRSMGHTASLAGSGREALELLAKEEPYELVISDYNMDDMNGIEFFDAAKAVPGFKGTPSLLFSGNDNPAVIKACDRRGIQFFLKGTGSVDDIIEKILGSN